MKTTKQYVDDFYKSFNEETKPLSGLLYNEDKSRAMNVESYFELLAEDIINEANKEIESWKDMAYVTGVNNDLQAEKLKAKDELLEEMAYMLEETKSNGYLSTGMVDKINDLLTKYNQSK